MQTHHVLESQFEGKQFTRSVLSSKPNPDCMCILALVEGPLDLNSPLRVICLHEICIDIVHSLTLLLTYPPPGTSYHFLITVLGKKHLDK